MPITRTIQGDLLALFKEDKFDAIAHGANCFHTMGAGVAGQIAKQFPEALYEDSRNHKRGDPVMGQYSYVETHHGTIFNLYTQYEPGKEKPQNLLSWIGTAFSRLDHDLNPLVNVHKNYGLPQIAIPKIGSGIAGGNWDDIVATINDTTPRLEIIVVEYVPS